MRGKSRIAGALLATTALAFLPAIAEAASVTASSETIVDKNPKAPSSFVQTKLLYTAAPGESNSLTVTAEPPGETSQALVFHDPGATITPAGDCSRVDDHTARCSMPRLAFTITRVELGDADDSATLTSGDVDAGPGNDVVVSGGTLLGGPGSDSLTGTDATGDTLIGGPDADTMDGRAAPGSLVDVVSYADRTTPVTVELSRGGDQGEAGEGDVIAGMEGAVGGAGDDVLRGTDALNILIGGPGADTIEGRGGEDQIIGRAGPDAIDGGDGHDTVHADEFEDPADDDRVDGGAGNDSLFGRGGNDRITGGEGDDTIEDFGGDNAIDGGPGADALTGGPGDDRVSGGPGRDTISGGRGRNTLSGGDGNDQIDVNDARRRRNEVSCGGGSRDIVLNVRPVDVIPRDCERVAPWPAVITESIPPYPRLRRGAALVRVPNPCDDGSEGPCIARILLRDGRGRLLGRGRIRLSLTRPHTRTLRIPLTRRGRALLRRGRTVQLTYRLANGADSVTGGYTASRTASTRGQPRG